MGANYNEAGPEPKAQFPLNDRLLMGVVIGMGVLLIVGVAGLFVAMAHKMGGGAKTDEVAVAAPPVQGAAMPPIMAPLGDHRVMVPTGHVLRGARLDGARLLLHLTAPDYAPLLLVVRLADGQVIGRYSLISAP